MGCPACGGETGADSGVAPGRCATCGLVLDAPSGPDDVGSDLPEHVGVVLGNTPRVERAGGVMDVPIRARTEPLAVANDASPDAPDYPERTRRARLWVFIAFFWPVALVVVLVAFGRCGAGDVADHF